jgi:hypothetical protein
LENRADLHGRNLLGFPIISVRFPEQNFLPYVKFYHEKKLADKITEIFPKIAQQWE